MRACEVGLLWPLRIGAMMNGSNVDDGRHGAHLDSGVNRASAGHCGARQIPAKLTELATLPIIAHPGSDYCGNS